MSSQNREPKQILPIQVASCQVFSHTGKKDNQCRHKRVNIAYLSDIFINGKLVKQKPGLQMTKRVKEEVVTLFRTISELCGWRIV